MATERQVVSVSLTQQQSDFIKNRPEGQSAYVQTLIDNQMNLPTNMQPDIPVIPISLEQFIIDNLDPNLVVRKDHDDLSACNRFHIGETHNDMTLTICQMVDKGFVTSWLTCRLRHYGNLPNNRYILDIDLLSRFRPNCQPFSFETRSDLLTYQLGNESNLVKAFLDTAKRLYPTQDKSSQDIPDLDSLAKAIHNSRFKVRFFSPIKNSPWNLPELPYYVNRVEFNRDEIKITFVDNESFALHKFMKKLYGLVSVDITTVKYDDGTDIETTRYNCCVSTSKPPYRTTLVYNSKDDICKTTVQFIVLQQDDANKLNQWSLYWAEHAINDKQFLSKPNLLMNLGLGPKPDFPLVLYTASVSLADLKDEKSIYDTDAEYLRKRVLANRLAVIARIYDIEGKNLCILTPENCSPAIDQNGNPTLKYKGLNTTIYYNPSDIVVLVPDYDRQSVVTLNTFPTNITRHQDQSGVFYTYTTACTTT